MANFDHLEQVMQRQGDKTGRLTFGRPPWHVKMASEVCDKVILNGSAGDYLVREKPSSKGGGAPPNNILCVNDHGSILKVMLPALPMTMKGKTVTTLAELIEELRTTPLKSKHAGRDDFKLARPCVVPSEFTSDREVGIRTKPFRGGKLGEQARGGGAAARQPRQRSATTSSHSATRSDPTSDLYGPVVLKKPEEELFGGFGSLDSRASASGTGSAKQLASELNAFRMRGGGGGGSGKYGFGTNGDEDGDGASLNPGAVTERKKAVPYIKVAAGTQQLYGSDGDHDYVNVASTTPRPRAATVSGSHESTKFWSPDSDSDEEEESAHSYENVFSTSDYQNAAKKDVVTKFPETHDYQNAGPEFIDL